MDGKLQLQVGDSLYELATDDSVTEIEVDEDIVDEISDINEEAYESLLANGATDEDVIESGLISEALKTLLIGGVVRLGKHYLTH